MDQYKYDGIIFGNGMTLNLFNQLKVHIPKEKQYLFSIDEFLKNSYQINCLLRKSNI